MAVNAIKLTGLGMPPQLASRVGNGIATVVGVGTAQATAALLSSVISILTTSSGQTAFVPSPHWGVGDDLRVTNPAATTALIFPPVGGNFNGGSTDASITVAQNANIILTKITSVNWISK